MNQSQMVWVFICISFVTYFLISVVYKNLRIQNLESAISSTNGLRLLNLKHILGIIFFGVIFYIAAPEYRFLILEVEIPKLHVLLIILTFIFLSGYVSHIAIKKKEINNLASEHFGLARACWYFIIRFVFLLCYEFFFRGILFYEILEFDSLFLAISGSTILYVLIHIFDTKKEIIGAIPFGILLCLCAFITKSVWYVFFIHLALSAVYEMSMFYCLTLKNSES